LQKSRDIVAITKAMFSTDEDRLLLDNNDGKRCGWVYLVWGNGADIISDYTTNLEDVLKPAQAIADRYH
jgi:hypothetical protein